MFQGELTAGTWEETSETISFADFSFVLTKHHLKQSQDDGPDRQKEGSIEEEKERDESRRDEEDQGKIPYIYIYILMHMRGCEPWW